MKGRENKNAKWKNEKKKEKINEENVCIVPCLAASIVDSYLALKVRSIVIIGNELFADHFELL